MKNLDNAINLAGKLGHVFVATADAGGMPHLSAAARIRSVSENRAAVSAWSCPGTIANLDQNRHIALVVRDTASDRGYQMLGEVVQVAKILAFSHAPHSDLEE